MKCIICKKKSEGPMKKDYIMLNENGKTRRSEALYPFCNHCYHSGDYSSLASAVINGAASDYAGTSSYAGRTDKEKRTSKDDATTFLFRGGIDFWSMILKKRPKDLRASIQNCIREGIV